MEQPSTSGQDPPVRAKGRLPSQIRPLLCERGLLQRADGSAKWAQDGSAVLAAVHGPVAAGPRREDPERAVVEVVFKPRSGLPGSKEHEMEETLRQTAAGVLLAGLHPRTAVTVVVQVLQADGSLLSCAINAACAALVDAGVPLASLFASVTAAVTPGGTLVIDPDAAEEAAARAVFCLAYPYRHSLEAEGGQQQQQQQAGGGKPPQQHLAVDEGVLALHAAGRFSTEELAAAMEACRRGCEGVAKFCRLSLLEGLKEIATKQQQ